MSSNFQKSGIDQETDPGHSPELFLLKMTLMQGKFLPNFPLAMFGCHSIRWKPNLLRLQRSLTLEVSAHSLGNGNLEQATLAQDETQGLFGPCWLMLHWITTPVLPQPHRPQCPPEMYI